MTKKLRSGFQRINPEGYVRSNIAQNIIDTECDNQNRQDEKVISDIADKVLYDKLSMGERRSIYKLLKGIEPPPSKRRGPKSKQLRDLALAADYIDRKAQEGIRAKVIRCELYELYNLSHGKTVQDPDSTFYKVFNRGLELLEYYSNLWINEVDSGCTCDMPPKYVERRTALAKHYLQCIAKHREQTKHLKNKAKKKSTVKI